MHSGVGPTDELNKHNIPIVHDLAGVGDHLMDHPMVNIRFRTGPGESLNYLKPLRFSFYDSLRRTAAIGRYLLTKTGPLTSNVSCFAPHKSFDTLTDAFM
jgi:choline dehydrogenase